MLISQFVINLHKKLTAH